MYWDEIAEEVETRAIAELAAIYRPSAADDSRVWKKHIVDVLSEKSKLLRALGAKRRSK